MRPSDSDRWVRIDELFAAAVELPAEELDDFLREACGSDRELREEVESLVAHHRDAGFLETPAADWVAGEPVEVVPGGLVGRRLDRFELLALIGSGAMGEIYLAHDPKLERRVALKLLPPHLVDDAERVRRFRREALALSSLNHPNILTIHEIIEAEGRVVLVSELVEGVTLRERSRRGPLSVATGLTLAAQVARALAAAHAVGIVHRDVKPDNVMIRRDGVVKLLDFGIARSRLPGVAPGRPGPTETASLTGVGVVLGTASYMSPEQARGEPAGPQADIWALGCVLYELLTGRQAFRGPTTSDVLAGILTREPEWEALPPDTPPLAASLLRRCLQKSPDRRMESALDCCLELEEAVRDPFPAPGGVRTRRWLAWVAWGGLVAVAALLGVVAMMLLRPSPPPAPALRFEVAPPPGERFSHWVESATLALSPDGSRLGFVTPGAPGAPRAIWVRPLADLASRRIAGTEGASSVFWSPDGESLGFVADGKIKRVPWAGGEAVGLCEVEKGAGVSGSWAADSILFSSVRGDAILRVSANGGTPTVVVRADPARDEQRLAWPWWLPGGERFLYLAFHSHGGSELRLAGVGEESRTVAPMTSRVEWVEPGFAVFASDGALLAQRLDADRAELVGPRRALASPVRAFGSTGWAGFATARSGPVAVATQNDLSRIAVVDGGGRILRTIGSPMAAAVSVSVSPDGRRAVTDRLRPGLATYDLWMLDLERGVESRLTDAPATEVYARWLPDGRSIVYSDTRGSIPNLLRLDLASGVEEELVPPGPFQIAVAVTPDGRRLIYRQRTADGFELLSAPLDRSGSPVALLRPGVPVWDAALSPDGQLLAYVAPENGRPELLVRRLEGGESVRVSEGGAWGSRFAADSRTLYFISFERTLAAVPVAGTPELTVGTVTDLFELPEAGWLDFDLLRDGGFLALIQETDGTAAPLTVMTGWNGPEESP